MRVLPTEEELWYWLTRLARSVVVDAHRRRSRFERFLERWTPFAVDAEISKEDPLARSADDQILEKLIEEMSSLPSEDRFLIEEKYLRGRSVRDLARSAEISEKGIESRLSRLREKLRKRVLDRLASTETP